MRCLLLFLTLFLFSLTACQQDRETIIPAGEEEVSFRAASRPFKGTLVLALAPIDIPQCSCEGELPGPLAGTGNLTHLGLTTMETEVCFEIISADQFEVTEQCVVFTAANGDELWASAEEYYGFFNPECFCNSATGVFNFYKGTGRFADASGQAGFHVVIDLDQTTFLPVQATVELDGYIQY